MNNLKELHTTVSMSDDEFVIFKNMIYSDFGIDLSSSKKIMLSARLHKRLKELKLDSFYKYYDFLKTSEGKNIEYDFLIDAVTTNKTDFFRENNHFELLKNELLSRLVHRKSFSYNKQIVCWSAGCSTGQEPYTLAMVLNDFFKQNFYYGGRFEILATDISKGALEIAQNAIYNQSEIESIPEQYRKKYLLRGKNNKSGKYKISPEISDSIVFKQLNLIDDHFSIHKRMDIVFCRNVVIYFDRDTQIKLFSKIYDILSPGGLLFVGSSETLYSISNKYSSIGPTVYVKA